MSKQILVAMDMDGTITQHKTPLEEQNRRVLDRLHEKYRLVMVGAGSCQRIFNQLGRYPLDVVGCYGMELSHYDETLQDLVVDEKFVAPAPDQAVMNEKARVIREKYGYTQYYGDSMEYHASGMMTFALLGTQAPIAEKIAFDPDRSKRHVFYREVCQAFSDYTVFVGGSSSFDIVPKPYEKCYALQKYCQLHGIDPENVYYFGDDYGPGGNDEQVFLSPLFKSIKVDLYTQFEERTAFLL